MLSRSPKSAWGKVILLGEHAVVYGHKAIAGAIDRGVQCTSGDSPIGRLNVPAWDLDVSVGDDHPVAHALHAMLCQAGSRALHIQATTNLPCGAGLGSSAALCVAMARCMTGDETAVQPLANLGETFFHQSPSGVDVALSSEGGLGLYTKTDGLTKLGSPPLPLVIGLSGVSRSTGKMVKGLRVRLTGSPHLGDVLLEVAAHASEGERLVRNHNLEALGTLMDQSHIALAALGLSIAPLDKMVAAAKRAGALGAKLTGAGGGGAMIALCPDNQDAVQAALQGLGFESFPAMLGATT